MSQRRLAAIMFADIVGYNSLLKEDEKKALKILQESRRIRKRLIRKFKGRLLKEMEGGILASFNSNIDAVMCALFIQKATEELRIPVHIGIHLGDVIFERNDVLGDGVNIASRIQRVTESKGIVISDTVYKDIKNKDGLIIEPQGTQTLKGVESPIDIYKVHCQDYSLLDYSIDTGEISRPMSFGRSTIVIGIIIITFLVYAMYLLLPKKIKNPTEHERSVLVLPFDNYTGSDTLEYFTAGMHNALIGEIGKIGALQVKSRTTSNAYKDVDKSIPDIAAELGVNVIVEGSVLCIGDSICLQVRMVSTEEEEKQLWVHDFKVERSQIQNLYSLVTRDFSDEINVILTPQEEKLLTETRLVDPAAHDLYMKGLVYNDQMSEDALQRAAQYFKLANEQDPGWAPPYRGMASVLERQYQMDFVERSIAMPKLSEYLEKALELDPNSSWVYNLTGSKAGWFEWDWRKGEQDFLKSIELNPNHAGNHAFYASMLTLLRRTEEALYHARKARELDPLNPFILGISASVLKEAGECQAAMNLIEKAISIEPNHFFTYPLMIEAALCVGDFQKAFEVMKELNYSMWEKHNQTGNFEKIFYEHGWLAFQEEAIKFYEDVGLKNNLREERDQVIRYISVKKYDKALDYFEKAYEMHSPNLSGISNNTFFNELKDNPRYIALLKKMNLPVD